ncbi:MAG: peptidylprolyl isomerase [Prolixibacteraceae bacterium]|jgi:FKBP-type peptidyl-prolyl cis-trans isomerase|nr:peptidylprolyl isomerase [Prolixibacteraceae bacterium]MBT6763530.1 peptidylprolyl isomerase [Prolixibacteraceae bacterium]MBT6999017.1 peptidylprolyl isomerase [Prolixibacteraceae bacterium]MBT7394484.1 peptidylprolyl isomerase [Prolixibacteraceae bacterium]
MAKREKKSRSKGSLGNNRKAGEDFLFRNAQKDKVVETETGLQYLIVDGGKGIKPTLFDRVKIHQRALLLDGKILEDTYRENKPDEVKLEELIEGLQEGLQLMAVGNRFKFWIPSELGWGRKGTGNKIPPNAVLTFDIRLLEIC